MSETLKKIDLHTEKTSGIAIATVAVALMLGVRAGNVALIAFLGYALFVGRNTFLSPDTRQWRMLLPVTLYIAYVVGLLWTENFQNAERELVRKIVLLACPAGVFLLFQKIRSKDFKLIFHLFVVACICLSVICYANAIGNIMRTGSLTVVELTEREYYYFTYLHLTQAVNIEPIYMSLFCNFCIMALLVEGFRNRWLNAITIVYLAVFLLFINAKIGLVALVVIAVLFLFFKLKSRTAALLAGVGLITLILTIVLNASFLANRFKVSTEFNFSEGYAGEWNSVSQRIAIWTCAADAAKKTFPWGNGTGDGQTALEDSYRKFNYYRGHQDNINAHSEFFQTQLDLGIVGNILLFVILVVPFYNAIKNKEFLMLAFIITITLYLLVEVVFARRHGVMFFSLFYALLIMYGQRLKKTNEI